MSEVRKPRSDAPGRHENVTREERLQINESEGMWGKMKDLGARSDGGLGDRSSCGEPVL